MTNPPSFSNGAVPTTGPGSTATAPGAVGGFRPGGAETAQRQRMVAAQWRRGTGTIDFLNGGTDRDLAWLVFIE